MAERESAWWFGLSVDHLYERCPLRLRSLKTLNLLDQDGEGSGTVDPLGEAICGWCARVWAARNPQAVST